MGNASHYIVYIKSRTQAKERNRMNTITMNSEGYVAYDRRVITTDKGFSFTPNATLPVANFLTDVHIHGSLNLINGNQINQIKTMNMNQQAKVAVFRVTRNEDGGITQSEFIQEFWIQKKPGVSIDFTVAKLLKEDLSPEEIIIKEIFTVIL